MFGNYGEIEITHFFTRVKKISTFTNEFEKEKSIHSQIQNLFKLRFCFN